MNNADIIKELTRDNLDLRKIMLDTFCNRDTVVSRETLTAKSGRK